MVKLTEEVWLIQRLIQVGFLVPLDSVELYNVSINSEGKPLKVNGDSEWVSSFLNNTLTTNYESAKMVSESLLEDNYKAEINKMISLGGKYYFVNTDMNLSANNSESEFFKNSNVMLTIRNGVKFMEQFCESGLNESFPIDYGMEKIYDQVFSEFSKIINNNNPLLLNKNVSYVYNKILELNNSHRMLKSNPESFKDIVQKIVVGFAGSINARTWLLDNPAMAIYGYIQNAYNNFELNSDELSNNKIKFSKNNISAELYNKLEPLYGNKEIPINWQYLATWIKKNKIVGGVSHTESDTPNKNSPVYSLLDLDTVKTESEQNQIYNQIINKYGELINLLSNVFENKQLEKFLLDASPKKCVDFINSSKTHPNLAKLFSGVWEGYSVGEHTEAVLKIYEENFSKTLPEELQPFMKLSILLHDIGKGAAIEKLRTGKRVTQHEETRELCKDFYKEFGINKNVSELMTFVILDAQKLTTEFYVGRNADAEQKLLEAINNKFKSVYNLNPTQNQVNAIASMCKILQTCDSYSYTPNSVIRRTGEHGDIYVYGANYNFGKNSKTGRNSVEYLRPDASVHPSDPYATIDVKKR